MQPFPDEESYRRALARVDELFEAHPDIEPGTPLGDELEALIDRITEHQAKLIAASLTSESSDS